MSVRRNLKNVVYNYSEAARKARDATSNDPWGPSAALMQELADLTYNMAAYADIMPIIWKRLNDNGKNWRHVYKSLVLLHYLVRYGSKRIAQQCRENIFMIQTLKDFQYFEANRDQGQNVREKAKQLVTLLKDEELLKRERSKAEAVRNSMFRDFNNLNQHVAGDHHFHPDNLNKHGHGDYYKHLYAGYEGGTNFDKQRPQSLYSNSLDPDVAKSYAAPSNLEEEAMQVQLALVLSKQEAEEEVRLRKSDHIKMSLAFKESLKSESDQIIDIMDSDFTNMNPIDQSDNDRSEMDIFSILDGTSRFQRNETNVFMKNQNENERQYKPNEDQVSLSQSKKAHQRSSAFIPKMNDPWGSNSDDLLNANLLGNELSKQDDFLTDFNFDNNENNSTKAKSTPLKSGNVNSYDMYNLTGISNAIRKAKDNINNASTVKTDSRTNLTNKNEIQEEKSLLSDIDSWAKSDEMLSSSSKNINPFLSNLRNSNKKIPTLNELKGSSTFHTDYHQQKN